MITRNSVVTLLGRYHSYLQTTKQTQEQCGKRQRGRERNRESKSQCKQWPGKSSAPKNSCEQEG